MESKPTRYVMQPDDEKILRLTKEIIIKFIELGRVSPSNFEHQFKNVFWTLKSTIVDAQLPADFHEKAGLEEKLEAE